RLSLFFFSYSGHHLRLHSFPTRRSSDLIALEIRNIFRLQRYPRCRRCSIELDWSALRQTASRLRHRRVQRPGERVTRPIGGVRRSEEHTSELQSRENLVCRLLLEKKKE